VDRRLMTPIELLEGAGHEDRVVIDTRTPEEYAAGHIPGAISLPEVYDYLLTDSRPAGLEALHRVLAELIGRVGLTGEERVVFYEAGTGMRCARGLWLLEYAGHPDAAVLDGGLLGWMSAGGTLTRAPVTRARTDYPLRPRPDILATADDILARQGEPGLLLLDVRREEEFRGRFQQGCCPRSGRIPVAVWLEWERLLEPPGLKASEAMQAELNAAGVTPDQEIVVYCHRGARSANTYLALKQLGYPRVRNFLGSWHEWSNRPELPLEKG
jgi:thiosulfate/3-mercaptopyruvate sulfurtransferase